METTEYQNNSNDQEQNYQNFQNQENNLVSSNQVYSSPSNTGSSSSSDGNAMWYYLSIITWVLFLITVWSLFLTSKSSIQISKSSSNNNYNPFQNFQYPWDDDDYDYDDDDAGYYTQSPINSELSFTYGLISLIGAVGFYFYFKYTTLEKNQGLYQGMLGDMSKFHCVPLLLISIIFILTNSITKAGCVFEIIFSILAFASLVFMYLQTDFEAQWYVVLTTKKGVYSSLIALTWYYFWAFINISDLTKDSQSKSFLKNSGVAFSILIGLGNIGFGVFFKDLIVIITNFLIYLGMTQYYYVNSLKDTFGKGCPVIEIIILVVNFAAFVYLIWKETDGVMRT